MWTVVLLCAAANAVMAPLSAKAATSGTRVRPQWQRQWWDALVLAWLGALLAFALGTWLGPWRAVPVTLGLSLAVRWIGLRHLRAAAELHRIGARLKGAEPDERARLAEALLDRMRRAMKPERGGEAPPLNVRLRLHASAALIDANCFDEAGRVLANLDAETLSGMDRTSLLVQRAILALYGEGGHGVARRLFDQIPRPAGGELEEQLVAFDALLFALEGEHDLALDLAGEGPDRPDAAEGLTRTRQVTRAHAYAGRGDEGRAKKALRELRRMSGDAALERVVQLRGPASALAAKLTNEDAPYR
jgi:hypothetical protein